jgi:hypothetical protein
MKITIESGASPAHLPRVWSDGKRLSPPGRSIADHCGWSDDALAALLGEKDFERYQEGRHAFKVTVSHYQLVAGLRSPTSTWEIKIQDAANA